MTIDTENIESRLETVRDLDDDDALGELRTAWLDLRRLRDEARTPADRERLDRLATRLSQRYLEIRERPAYDEGSVQTLNPSEENAP